MQKNLKRIQQRFTRRLNTHEDFMNIHKISSMFWLGSLLWISTVGFMNGFDNVPSYLEIPTWIALVSSFIQGFNGCDMAIKYRGGSQKKIIQHVMV